MTLSISKVNMSIATGKLAAVSRQGGRGQLILVGPSSAGDVETITPVTTHSAVLAFGHGPLVDAAAYALAYEVDRCLMLRTDPDDEDPGEYGTITQTGTGTVVVEADSTVVPGDDLEVIVEWITSGTIGTAGIKYRYSLDDGRKFSGTLSLGTAQYIQLPLGGGTYLLEPPLAAFLTFVNECRTDFLAHIVLTDGSVHLAADTTSDDDVPAAATDETTAIALANALVAAGILHFTNNTAHTIDDTTNGALLTALTTATTLQQAAGNMAVFKTAYEAHRVLLTGTVHGAADSTNVISGSVSRGTVVAGDTFSLMTKAPRWTSDALVSALTVLKNSQGARFGTIEIVGPFETQGEIEAAQTALLAMRTKIKYRRAIGHVRMRGSDGAETVTAYASDIEDLVTGVNANQLALTPSVYMPSAANPGAIYVRPFSFAVAPRTAKLREDISANSRTEFGSLTCQIRDSEGAVLPRAVDEFDQELFTPLRCFAPRTWPDKQNSQIYAAMGTTLGADDDDTQLLRVGQVLDLAAEVAYSPLADYCGGGLVPAPDNTLERNQKKRIEESVGKVLDAALVKTGIAVGARLVIDPDQIIVGTPPIIITATVLVRIKGYADEFEVEVAVDATPAA